jgi:hypothetical protein
MAASPRPSRSITCGLKFCTSTSERAISFFRISRPSGCLRSTDSERLPRLVEMNRAENWPVGSTDWRLRRVMSPPGGSTLITSAPWSARNIVANGPDTTLVRSMTRTPDNGPVTRASRFVSARILGDRQQPHNDIDVMMWRPKLIPGDRLGFLIEPALS